MKAVSLLEDIRALGPALPVRAAYEASKRLGGHALIFGRLVPKEAPDSIISPFPEPTDIPDDVRDRTLAEANQIIDGTVDIFGTQLDLGDEIDWHSVIHQSGSWPIKPWWKLDIGGTDRPGDVKWVWELSRHRHLVILARAVWLNESDHRYQAKLESHLRTWIDQNPPETGVHWYSSLEIALRALAWLQIIGLVGAQLDTQLASEMHQVLYHSGRHLMADIAHTATTMRNNHLLGDALGLVALGMAFDQDGTAQRWRRVGDKLLRHHVARTFYADGSCIEDSVSYHRFVVEMLAVRVMLGGAPEVVRRTLPDACQFLARLGVLDGSVPQYGDSDDGRAVVSASSDPLSGAVRLGLALDGTGADPRWRTLHDEVAWYAPSGESTRPEPAELGGADVGANIARVQQGPFTVWLKAGSGDSHGHADLLSTSVRWHEQWIVGDPGTGTYNGPLDERTYFRSSLAHNVLRVEGEDHRVAHRSFQWLYSPSGRLGPPLSIGEATVAWGIHDAYTRLSPRRRVARAALVTSDALVVADWVEGPPGPYLLSVTLHPDIEVLEGAVALPRGTRLILDLPASPTTVTGSSVPFDGWWSNAYGSKRPTPRMYLGGRTGTPVCWSLRTSDSSKPQLSGQVVRLDDIEITLSWVQDGAILRGTASGEVREAHVSL